jgi:SAM-dependent methyltransferase
VLRRFLAGQFARPHGLVGRWIIAPWLDRIGRRSNALALAELAPAQGERVLEIGIGGGALLAAMSAHPVAEVIGVDISEAALARARRRLAGDRRLRLVQASAEALPLKARSVDKAVSVHSLYFWSDPKAAMDELARVLRPRGRLVLLFEPTEELRKWPGHRHGFRLFEVAEVQRLMEGAGFAAIEERWGTGRKPDRFCCLSGTRIGANRSA